MDEPSQGEPPHTARRLLPYLLSGGRPFSQRPQSPLGVSPTLSQGTGYRCRGSE